MMFFLTFNIINKKWNFLFAVGKGTVAFLPGKPISYEPFLLYPFAGISLDILHQIGNRLGGPKACKNVDMIRHSVYCQKFMIMIPKDACHVFKQFITPGILKEAFAILNSKNKLHMNLGISVCHNVLMYLVRFYPYTVPDGTGRW